MTFYLIGASLTFSLLLNAFLQDEFSPNSDLSSWMVVLVASLLWFVCLPCVIRKKFTGVLRWLFPVSAEQEA
ncbi:hypothetical protein [Leptolyngbya ohadii]|uniref:hypothetical protein n=1 Tax=Leptolyngbya ohadii TaxID=1962290 RepID=UPI000B59FD52|nr:hypothetical protein [Leptolyngbya ohadii]